MDLNVGGTHMITTTRNTLTSVKDSSLAAMFSGRHKITQHNGRYFIDRDGEAFSAMLSFLRTGKVPIFANQNQENAFYDELDFWVIPIEGGISFSSSRELLTGKSTQLFDAEWCANTLQMSPDQLTIKKNGNQHGIVFCKQPLDIFNSYVEFKVEIENIFAGKSHLFVGMVDR